MPTAPLATIALDDRQAYFLREMLSPRQFKQAAYQTVMRTARTLKTRVGDVLKNDTNISRDAAAAAVEIQSDHGDMPVARLVISGRGVPLSEMKAKASRRFGVTVQPTKGKPVLHFAHAFEATMRSGHKGVFNRAKLPVVTPETTAADLVKLGFEPAEAKRLTGFAYALKTDTEFLEAAITGPRPHLIGRGIRHQKRLAFGGEFPDVSPQGIAWRLPIKELRGPSPAGIIGVAERLKPLLADADALIAKNARSQLDRFTKPTV